MLRRKVETSGEMGCAGGAIVYRTMALRHVGREGEARKVFSQAEQLPAERIGTRAEAQAWGWELEICELAFNEARQMFGRLPKR